MSFEEHVAVAFYKIPKARQFIRSIVRGGDENAEVPDSNYERLPVGEAGLGEHRKHSERRADRNPALEVQ